jgi:hypothetical protein
MEVLIDKKCISYPIRFRLFGRERILGSVSLFLYRKEVNPSVRPPIIKPFTKNNIRSAPSIILVPLNFIFRVSLRVGGT